MKPILEVVHAIPPGAPAVLGAADVSAAVASEPASAIASATVSTTIPAQPIARVRQAHHALGMIRNPFPPTPDAQGYFFTESLSSDFAETLHCIRSRKGFVLITGEVGLGKSTFVRNLMDTLVLENTAVSLVLNTFLQGGELLSAINDDFGLIHETPVVASASLDANLAVQLTRLNAFLLHCASARKNCVLIIDDAQNLNRQSLELVRLLCNVETGQEKLLQIVLVGQPELLETLSEPSLRQLKSRIVKHVQLLGLTMSDTSRYIDYRMIQAGLGGENVAAGQQQIHLRPEAVTTLFSATLGNPRQLNMVMDRCLYGLVASRSRVVTQDLVRAGVAETTVASSGKLLPRDGAAQTVMVMSPRALFQKYFLPYASAWAAMGIALPALALAGWSVWRDNGAVGPAAAAPTLVFAATVPAVPLGSSLHAVKIVAGEALQSQTRVANPTDAPTPTTLQTPPFGAASMAAMPAITAAPAAVPLDTRLSECASRLTKMTSANSLQQMHLQPISVSAVAQYGKTLEARNLACVLNQGDAAILMWKLTAFSEQARAAQPNAALQSLQRKLQQMGFLTDSRVDGWLGPRTKDSLKHFQAKYNLPLSGEPDALTTLLLENFDG